MIDEEVMDFDELSDGDAEQVADLVSKLGIKDYDEMVEDTMAMIVDADVGITNTTIGSVLRTLVEAVLYHSDALNYYISYVYKQLGLSDASGDDLDRLVSILGVVRIPASYAKANVIFSTGDEPYENDIIIPTGTIVSTKQDTDGTIYEFQVINTTTLEAGDTSVSVEVQAIDPGYIYLPISSISILSEPIIGIESINNTTIVDSGEDIESDDDLRERTKNMSTLYGKCTKGALELAVEQLDGVTACTVVDRPNNVVGTINVVVSTNVIPPSQSLKDQIASVVANVKAAGINASIVYPTVTNIEILVTITSNGTNIDTSSHSAVIQSINNYVNSLTIGKSFIISQMERYVLNTLDGDNIDMSTSTPTANVSVDNSHIIRTNKITINGVVYNV